MRSRSARAVSLFLLIATASAPFSTVQAGDRVLLKPRYTKGDSAYVEATVNMKSSSNSPMGRMEMKITKKIGQIQKTESASMDGAKLSFKFDRVQFGLDSAMLGDLRFDSDIPSVEDAPYLKQMFEPFLGQALGMSIGRDGKATAVTGVEEIVKKVESGSSGNPFTMNFRRTFNEEVLMHHWNLAFSSLLPNKEVAVGDTWKYEGEDDIPQLGLAVRFECTCKLERLGTHKGHAAAFVSFEGKARDCYRKFAPGMPTPELEVKSGSMKGDYVFDVEAGSIVRESMRIESELAPRAEKTSDTSDAPDSKKEGAKKNSTTDMSIKTQSENAIEILALEERVAEKKKNDQLAAELKAKEEAEDAGGDEDESDDDGAGKDE